MDKELVIKLKYGDTIRRFRVLFDGNGSINLDISGLKAKIVNLLKLTPDVDFTLTYVDEDGDWVTIDNDEDLHDAVRQRFNPLRITVSLDTYNAGNVYGSGSPTPWSRSGAFPKPHSFPLPPPHPSRHFPCQPPFPSGPPLSDDKASSEAVSSQEQLISKLVKQLTCIVSSIAPEKYNDFISKLSDDMITRAAETLSMLATPDKRSEECKISSGVKASRDSLVASGDGASELMSFLQRTETAKNCNGNSSRNNMKMIFHPGVECDGCGVQPILGPRYKSKVKKDYDLCSFCVAEEGKQSDYTRMDLPMHYPRSQTVVPTHLGIECDACGVVPITGPRYKSKVKENYDLCSKCFAKLGNEADYTKMDCSPRLRYKETNRRKLVWNKGRAVKPVVVDLVDSGSD